ncbi:tetratricopeptide repeat protein [bacterium]|nr:tetratricopeptide repeat protein [bacterium]
MILLVALGDSTWGQDIYVTFEEVRFIANNRVKAIVFVQNFGATRYVGAYYGETGMYPGFEERCEFSLSYTDVSSGRETRRMPTSITVETIFGGSIPMDIPMYELPTTGSSSGQRWEVLFPSVPKDAANVVVWILGADYSLGDTPGASKIKRERIAAEEKDRKERRALAIRLQSEGTSLLKAKQWTGALEKLRGAVELDTSLSGKVKPMIAKASLEIADSLRLNNDLEGAIGAYTEALEADPTQQNTVRLLRAQCFSQLAERGMRDGNYDLAIKYFSAACVDNDSLAAYCNAKLVECRHHKAQELHDSGMVAFHEGDFQCAISSLKSAADQDPTFEPVVVDRVTDCWFQLGEREIQRRNYRAARMNFLQAGQVSSIGVERVDRRFRQLRRSPGVTAAFSLLPGGGQLVNEQPGKAKLHFAAFAVLAGISILELSVADHQYEKYRKATDTKSARELYQKTERAWTACLVGSSAAALVVSFSMWDAYRSAKRFNKYFELP